MFSQLSSGKQRFYFSQTRRNVYLNEKSGGINILKTGNPDRVGAGYDFSMCCLLMRGKTERIQESFDERFGLQIEISV